MNGVDLTHVAYADTACARSVTGQENADSIVAHCRQNNWPYRLVEDREPFRFGPGKRIWSSQALILALVWGRISIVIRFSIVPPEVPFLISKYVFKRIGALLDLDDNQLVLKRFCTNTSEGIEPLYDLMSGHIAVELVPQGQQPPKISEDTLDLASSGHEVMVNDPELREKMNDCAVNDNNTHVTTVIPIFSKPTVHFDLTKDDSEVEPVLKGAAGDSHSESEPDFPLVDSSSDSEHGGYTDWSDTEDDIEADYFTSLVTPKKLNARSRAAPFYNELAPGWRARGELFAPYFSRNAIPLDTMAGPEEECSEDVIPGLGNGDDEDCDETHNTPKR